MKNKILTKKKKEKINTYNIQKNMITDEIYYYDKDLEFYFFFRF